MKVLVLTGVDEAQKKQLEAQAPSAEFVYATRETAAGYLEGCDVIIGNPPAGRLKDIPSLKLLQLESAGTGDYALPGVLPEGAVLTNATGAYGLAISEHMLGMLLELYKKLHLYRDRQRESVWGDEGMVKAVYGSVALIVGLGDIGGEFARRIHALGGYTIGVRRQNTDKPDYLDELYRQDQLDELLPRADIVALSVPATPQTRHIIDAARVARMKEGAVLLNVGRGNAVDTDALCDALESGRLWGAGLDVTDPEPLPASHRLWRIPNCVITPHVSGGRHLAATFDKILDISCRNLKAFVAGEPLTNVVDFATGYRKL